MQAGPYLVLGNEVAPQELLHHSGPASDRAAAGGQWDNCTVNPDGLCFGGSNRQHVRGTGIGIPLAEAPEDLVEVDARERVIRMVLVHVPLDREDPVQNILRKQ
jgi:hypothetical protein